jgi:hypothetical protein
MEKDNGQQQRMIVVEEKEKEKSSLMESSSTKMAMASLEDALPVVIRPTPTSVGVNGHFQIESRRPTVPFSYGRWSLFGSTGTEQ